MDHAEARAILSDALMRELGRRPTLGELEAVQAVAHAETNYGQGWRGPGKGSNNWGAVNCTRPEWGCFEHRDTDGKGSPVIARFQVYPSPLEGAADVARNVLLSRRDPSRNVLAAIATGDVDAFSRALWTRGYYTPRFPGQSEDARIAEHAAAMRRALEAFGAAGLPRELGQPRERPVLPRPELGPSSTGAGTALALAAAAWLALRGAPRRRARARA